MRWRSIPRLYRRRLKATLVPEVLATLGIAIGVALLFASQVAGTTLSGSASKLASAVLGSVRLEVEARSLQGFDASTVARVRAIPGVRAAIPVLEEPANAIGPHGETSIELVGVEPSAAKLGGAAVRRFSGSQLAHSEALAVPERIISAIGDAREAPITLQIAGRNRQPAFVGLEVKTKESALIASSPLVVAPLSFAQQLAGVGNRVTRIFVTPAAGREAAVKRALLALAGDRLNVRPAGFDATLFEQAAAPINQSTTLFSAISALVGLIFAIYAMLLTVPHRRNLVYELRFIGYTRGEVIKILAFDAIVLGTCASILGYVFGEILSSLYLHANPGYLVYAFAISTQRQVTVADIGFTVCAAMLTAFVGVFAPGRQIFSRFQQQERASHDLSRQYRDGMAIGGVVCLGLTTAVLYFAPRLALLGMASLTLSVVLLLPIILDGVVAFGTWVRGRIIGSTPRIAVTDLRYPSYRLRSIAIAATGAVAVFGSVAIGGARQNLQRGLNNSSQAFNSYGQLWVAPVGNYDLFTTTPISSDVAVRTGRSLRQLPGVQRVERYGGAYLDIGSRRTWVLAPPVSASVPISPTQLVEGSLAKATRRFRAGGVVAVSQSLASEHGLRIGSVFRLPTPVPTTLRVAAIGTNLGWPSGALILNAADYARAWGSSAPSAFLLTLQPGASLAEVKAEVTHALGSETGLAVESTQYRIDRGHAASHAGLSQLGQISDMVLITAVIAMAIAMTTLIWQRRPMLAQQQTEGFYRVTLWGALVMETAVLLGTGCLVGALAGIYGQLLLSHALASVTGFPVVVSIGALIAMTSFALVTAVAVAVVAIPGYFAARVRPAILISE